MSIETLDYTVIVNGHTVTCFEVGSVPTIGYASIENAMTDTNPVIVPECIFEAVNALLDQGVRLTTIYAHMDEDGYAYMKWDEIPEELTAEDIALIEGEESVRKSDKLSRKSRRARRIDRNKSHKGSDRAHGKKRPVSRKDFRHAERQELRKVGSNAHIPYLWTTDLKGNYVPVRVERHKREERFMPSPDWNGNPDPLMPAERLERNQQIEQLKNQLDITDWEMRDATDRIQWCREDIQEIEWHKNREAEVRQSLKEWQDRLNTLSRQYHDLMERILNLSV